MMDFVLQLQEELKILNIFTMSFIDHGWLHTFEKVLVAILVLVFLNIWSHFYLYDISILWLKSLYYGARAMHKNILRGLTRVKKECNFVEISLPCTGMEGDFSDNRAIDAICVGNGRIRLQPETPLHKPEVACDNQCTVRCPSRIRDVSGVSRCCSQEQDRGDQESVSLGQRVQEACGIENNTPNNQSIKSSDKPPFSYIKKQGEGDTKSSFDDVNQSNHFSSHHDKSCADFRNNSSPPKTQKKPCTDLFNMWRVGTSATQTRTNLCDNGGRDNAAAFLLKSRPSSACEGRYRYSDLETDKNNLVPGSKDKTVTFLQECNTFGVCVENCNRGTNKNYESNVFPTSGDNAPTFLLKSRPASACGVTYNEAHYTKKTTDRFDGKDNTTKIPFRPRPSSACGRQHSGDCCKSGRSVYGQNSWKSTFGSEPYGSHFGARDTSFGIHKRNDNRPAAGLSSVNQSSFSPIMNSKEQHYVCRNDSFRKPGVISEKKLVSFGAHNSIDNKPPSGLSTAYRQSCFQSSNTGICQNKQCHFEAKVHNQKRDYLSNTDRFLMAGKLDSFNRYKSPGYFTNYASIGNSKSSSQNIISGKSSQSNLSWKTVTF